jgi:hypothetical protein
MDFYVKYYYKGRTTGETLLQGRRRFDSYGEALRWAMETKASRAIYGFRLVDIIPQGRISVNYPASTRGISEYRYEGSTDAELIGMRY